MFIVNFYQCNSVRRGRKEKGLANPQAAGPFIENKKRPGARPGGAGGKKVLPSLLNALGFQKRDKRRSDFTEARFEVRPQRAAQPMFPRESKGAFALSENFGRENLMERFDQKRFVRAGAAAGDIGRAQTNSTSGVSRSGTRTSKELAMLTESVSRRRVPAM